MLGLPPLLRARRASYLQYHYSLQMSGGMLLPDGSRLTVARGRGALGLGRHGPAPRAFTPPSPASSSAPNSAAQASPAPPSAARSIAGRGGTACGILGSNSDARTPTDSSRDSTVLPPSPSPASTYGAKGGAGAGLSHNIVWAPPGKLRQRAAMRQHGGAGRRVTAPVAAPRDESAGSPAHRLSSQPSDQPRTPLTARLRKAWSVAEVAAALRKQPPSELNHLNVSFALNKLAKLAKSGSGGELDMALALLERQLLREGRTYPARSLATALRALAKLRRVNPDLFSVAAQRAMQLGPELTPQVGAPPVILPLRWQKPKNKQKEPDMCPPPPPVSWL